MKIISIFLLVISLCVATSSATEISKLEVRANAGDADALNQLGSYYQNGKGVSQDDAKAFSQYKKSADYGHPIAEYNLAFMYDIGLSVAKDRRAANKWYLESAESGYAPAMLNLGMNIAGGEGADPDLIEGMMWIDIARFFTQREKDMQMKYRIRDGYDYLKEMMTKKQVREAKKRSKTWIKQFRSKQKDS